jgi:hypothetical protein
MSTNREFLKEAIADAKTVKETAIANAKLALEESFEPYLKQVLALKLEEMEKSDIDDDETIYEDENLDEVEEIQEEFDLEEILAELEGESIDEDETLNEAEEEESEVEGGDFELPEDDELKSLIEDVIEDMIKSGELEPGPDYEEEDEEEDEELDINIEDDEDMGGLDEMEDVEEGYKEVEEAGMAQLKTDLKEAFETIKVLRSELNEINLLNAKLLYVNKIFKSKNNLTENQKVKVIGAFDKATTVKEAKLVFESLNENIKPTVEPKKHISESLLKSASKSLNANPRSTKQPILESNEMVARFQKLAGII